MPKKKKSGDVVSVGLVQMSCEQKPETNLKKAIAGINNAAKRGAKIVCLQELFRSQYFCQTEDIELFKLAETIPGPSTDALCKVARQKDVVIVASLFEKRAAGVYHNTAVMIDASGKIVGKYLSPFLASLGVTDLHPSEEEDVLRIEIDAAAAHEVNWPSRK